MKLFNGSTPCGDEPTRSRESPPPAPQAYPHAYMSQEALAVFRTRICEQHRQGLCREADRCPHSHCQTWQRRNPNEFTYSPKLCPDIEFLKKGKKMTLLRRCCRGRGCTFAHSKEEELYHPSIYKTKFCNVLICTRYFCPFAHLQDELRKSQVPPLLPPTVHDGLPSSHFPPPKSYQGPPHVVVSSWTWSNSTPCAPPFMLTLPGSSRYQAWKSEKPLMTQPLRLKRQPFETSHDQNPSEVVAEPSKINEPQGHSGQSDEAALGSPTSSSTTASSLQSPPPTRSGGTPSGLPHISLLMSREKKTPQRGTTEQAVPSPVSWGGFRPMKGETFKATPQDNMGCGHHDGAVTPRFLSTFFLPVYEACCASRGAELSDLSGSFPSSSSSSTLNPLDSFSPRYPSLTTRFHRYVDPLDELMLLKDSSEGTSVGWKNEPGDGARGCDLFHFSGLKNGCCVRYDQGKRVEETSGGCCRRTGEQETLGWSTGRCFGDQHDYRSLLESLAPLNTRAKWTDKDTSPLLVTPCSSSQELATGGPRHNSVGRLFSKKEEASTLLSTPTSIQEGTAHPKHHGGLNQPVDPPFPERFSLDKKTVHGESLFNKGQDSTSLSSRSSLTMKDSPSHLLTEALCTSRLVFPFDSASHWIPKGLIP